MGGWCPDHAQLWQSVPAALRAHARVDRVELKAIVDSDLETAMAVLGSEVEQPRLRCIHYLDTPDLSLYRHGVIVRARVNERVGKGDVVVKLRRPMLHIARAATNLVVELDALPAETAWAASLKRRRTPEAIARALGRRRPARALLTKNQRALVTRLAGDEIDVDDLVAFGPVDVVRLTSGRAEERIGVEAWTLPDGSRMVELFAKCCPTRSDAIAALVRDLISDHRIALAVEQVTKTQMSLERLARARRRPLRQALPRRQAPATAGGAPGRRHAVERAARPCDHELAVRHDVVEVLAERRHDLREAPGEWPLLTTP
ncbi:hypothetical protein BJF90_34745 [Pseudonocardia sp. CNS-004]|nr:hypothetical protein BJF90_34745 [Pseudonocardia sp. CNS-004]